MQGRFLPVRGAGAGAERRPAIIHLRESSGSMTSLICGCSRKVSRTAPFSDLIDHEIAPENAVDNGEAFQAKNHLKSRRLPAPDIDGVDGSGF